ncbi:DUF554 domain-containing protein [Alkalibacter rhizosphaerae]|uniref:DUF554 domain-containing protein n=1 Tax=Alkalibacter rhizosphaerae TaxID=2815577 RepID=A0A974XDU9_9FIRM|nr:DUF554 domain-containing protein [Alkalibacter rhizosphaerae]QSX08027.1 DUF554 domain-containing protein [Alkalibacter rhizosphaerae]
MTGNIVNTVAILIGGTLGLVFKSKISERFSNIMVEALGIAIMVYGISQGITTNNPLILFTSIALGALIGEILDIEKKLNELGDFFQSRMKNATGVTQGFVTASLLFCVGAMAIMGGLQGGLQGEHDILYAKAFLDGVMSIIFASALGIGVLLSAASVFLYQGAIVLLSGFLKPYLAAAVVVEMTAVGGVLIFAIGITMLKIKHLKLGNMLPAVFIPILINLFYTL